MNAAGDRVEGTEDGIHGRSIKLRFDVGGNLLGYFVRIGVCGNPDDTPDRMPVSAASEGVVTGLIGPGGILIVAGWGEANGDLNRYGCNVKAGSASILFDVRQRFLFGRENGVVKGFIVPGDPVTGRGFQAGDKASPLREEFRRD